MEHVEILTPKVTECPSFTVNNAVDSVDVTATGVWTTLYGAQGLKNFKRGDNFIILSAGYFVPERFVIYGYGAAGVILTPSPELFLSILKQGGLHQPVYPFGTDGSIKFPFPNYEFSIGAFVDVEDLAVQSVTYQLECTFPFANGEPDNLKISMIDVPAALNTKVFRIVPFVKVLHTEYLTV
jgi:hypothetical protein